MIKKASFNVVTAMLDMQLEAIKNNDTFVTKMPSFSDWKEIKSAYSRGEITEKQLDVLFGEVYNAFAAFYEKYPAGEKITTEYVSNGKICMDESISEYPDFNQICKQFQLYFPKDGRIQGVVYFDSLFEDWCNEKKLIKDTTPPEVKTEEIINIFQLRNSCVECTPSINKYFTPFISRHRDVGLVPLRDVYTLKRVDDIINDVIARNSSHQFNEYVKTDPFISEYVTEFKRGYFELINESPVNSSSFRDDVYSAATNLYTPFFYDPENSSLPDTWGEVGYNIGRFYSAWCIVLKKQRHFEPLFEQIEESKPTLLTIYGKDEKKLSEAHDSAVKNNLIASDIDSWLYWLAGKPCKNPKKIKWNKARTELRYYINKICPELERRNVKYPLINKVFAPKGSRLIDSNDKIPKTHTSNTRLIDSLI